MTSAAARDLELAALAALTAARSTVAQASIVEELAARVVDALAQVATTDELAPVPTVLRCAHPDEDRRNAATLRAPRRFYCAQCSEFINPGETPPSPPTT